jgi:hypothetical protein
MDGNIEGILLEGASLGIGQSFRLVRDARNLSASEKLYMNTVIFKAQGVGQVGSQVSGGIR